MLLGYGIMVRLPPRPVAMSFLSRRKGHMLSSHARLQGLIVCAMMLGLGEMISALPLPGGHITLARRFVNEVFSISLGWLYYYDWGASGCVAVAVESAS